MLRDTYLFFFFFFQAEDGIRDYKVTGVQTCALPILRGARTLNGAHTPILGVNLGLVGFLTTATSQTLDWALDALVRRAYVTESRLALAPFIEDKQGRSRAEPIVLNDAVVHKGGVARVIRLRVSVDG